ncbi:Scr1 family TA system antitoxin-like transcriptional regulator [Nocardiopsis flavescens]|uniref:Scr1 family TA system antitoxin-like transcriptional regulator n=1 Tax=Nocardiopsis flavescens TaxID=758803 RepID=UPI00366072F7
MPESLTAPLVAEQIYFLAQERAMPTQAFCPGVIPGPAQTEAMARALCERSSIYTSQSQVEEAVKVRMDRNRALLEPGPKRVYVLSPMALTSTILDRAARRAQLDHLDKIAALDHVDLRVLPLSSPVTWTTGFLLRDGRPLIEGPSRVIQLGESDYPYFDALFHRLLSASVPYAADLA